MVIDLIEVFVLYFNPPSMPLGCILESLFHGVGLLLKLGIVQTAGLEDELGLVTDNILCPGGYEGADVGGGLAVDA